MIATCAICRKSLPIYQWGKFTCGAEACGPIAQSGKVVDTGIFQTTLPRNRAEELLDYLRSRSDSHLPYLRKIDPLHDEAAAQIKKHGFALEPSTRNLSQAPAAVRDNYILLREFAVLNETASTFISHREVDPRMFWRMIDAALAIGALGERHNARKRNAEEDALRGRKSLEAQKKGHAKRYGTQSEIERRRAQYLTDYLHYRKAHPKATRTAAAKKIAKKYGVSPRTILKCTLQDSK